MGPSALISTVIRNVLEYLSTKNFGQFIIKKLDAILWTVEKPAKFCVHGSKRFETYRISPAVFWTILIILQVVRMSLSNILVKCKKHPIEAIDVMKTIQKWRRTLRTIRFGGLQKMRESDIGILNGTVDLTTSTPTPRQSRQKSENGDMSDYDLFDELLNRTFSDSDNAMDSTFTIGRSENMSMNLSSNGLTFLEEDEDEYNPSDTTENNISLNDTQPFGSTSESELKALKSSLYSTVDDTDQSAFIMNRECTTSSPNERRTMFEYNDTSVADGAEQAGVPESDSDQRTSSDKAYLNQRGDPADDLMSKLMQKQKDGTINVRLNANLQKYHKNHAKSSSDTKLSGISKHKNIVRSSPESVNRKSIKSYETLD